jgi:hypothetical protein
MEKETKMKKYDYIESVDFEGFECNSGWDTLIITALDTIESYLQWKHKEDPNAGHIFLDQVKEKFGTLRIYYTDHSNYRDYVSGVIDLAESMSVHICEECGKPGKTRGDLSWMRTLCEDHYIDAKARQHDYTKLIDSEK